MGSYKYFKRSKSGKVNTLLNKKLQSVEWGEFNLEKLFGKATRGKRLKSFDRNSGALPFVTAGEANEGISALIGNDITVFSENTITIDMFGSAKYRNYKYGGDDHISVIHTENLKKFASIFVTSAIHKSSYTGEFNYGRNFYPKDADELNISLPIKNGKIDFEFMESFIAELEVARISKLKIYLLASGLNDYTLTNEEKKVLNDFNSSKFELEEFQIDTLFSVSPSKTYKMNDIDILAENGKTPYVSNQSQSNGYIGRSNLPPLNPSNVITLSDTWQSERTIFYQPTEFIGKSHLQVMKSFDKRFKKLELFFVISSFRKAITELNYDYGTKFNRTKINATKIQLPTKNNQPDYKLMETLISAIQKIVIKDVVLYVEKKLDD